MEGSEPQPSGFSRRELDRVIRRAVELQFEAGADDDAPRLDEEELRRIGADVGIDERFLRRAIGELRAERLVPDASSDTGGLDRFVGSRAVRAHRVVPGSVEEIDSRLGEHLQVAETLSPVRDRGGRSLWEPDSGILAGLRRGIGWRGYRYELARITDLRVSVTPMEEGFVLVSLAADLGKIRRGHVAGFTIALGLIGGGVGVAAGVLAEMPTLVYLAFGALGILTGAFAGIRAARGVFGRSARRVRLTIEGILDRLERGKPLARRSLPRDWKKRLEEG